MANDALLPAAQFWRHWPFLTGDASREPHSPLLRYDAQHKAIIEQEHTQGENQIVQKSVVRRQDHTEFPGGDNEKAYDSPTAWREEHPNQAQLQSQRGIHRPSMKPVWQVLHIPANPSRQRSVLVVLIHCREMTPFGVAA